MRPLHLSGMGDIPFHNMLVWSSNSLCVSFALLLPPQTSPPMSPTAASRLVLSSVFDHVLVLLLAAFMLSTLLCSCQLELRAASKLQVSSDSCHHACFVLSMSPSFTW